MTEIGDMRGGSVLRHCDKCNLNTWHKIEMCGVCGSTNKGADKKRCRACGGMFDSLVNDYPGLQGQCDGCIKLYQEQNDMSSDMYSCASCMKYKNVFDMHKSESGKMVCKECCSKYEPAYLTPAEMGRSDKSSSDLSPKIAPVGGPGSDHYTAHTITPMEYVKGIGRDEYRGACVLNVIKYVTRFHLKGKPAEDLQKAKWYVEQLIVAQDEIEAAEK